MVLGKTPNYSRDVQKRLRRGSLQMSDKKRRVDSGRCRLSIEDCLPGDLLESLLGFLDRETLFTARLVSKTFCAAASAHVCSVTLKTIPWAMTLYRFTRLQHVSVYLDVLTQRLQSVDPCLLAIITKLTAEEPPTDPVPSCTYATLPHLNLMPKLRELILQDNIMYGAEELRCCVNLEAIAFNDCIICVASSLVNMTRVTSISLYRVFMMRDRVNLAGSSWLQQATNLQALEICILENGADHALPLIGNLTKLSRLTLRRTGRDVTVSIAPLTRLTNLQCLKIKFDVNESNLGIACCVGSGSLVKLKLSVDRAASAVCGRFLAGQTALKRLSLSYDQPCNSRHLGALRMELLESLKLDGLELRDPGGLSALCRATSLTKLFIRAAVVQPHVGLSQAVAQLTKLRALLVASDDVLPGVPASKLMNYPLALAPLTALTKLHVEDECLENLDLQALSVLTGLRVLKVWCYRAGDVLPELGVLANLKQLCVRDVRWGADTLVSVHEVVNPKREARGLPPVHIEEYTLTM